MNLIEFLDFSQWDFWDGIESGADFEGVEPCCLKDRHLHAGIGQSTPKLGGSKSGSENGIKAIWPNNGVVLRGTFRLPGG